MAARSNVGTTLVREWARREVPAGGFIVDVACGSGVPLAQALIEDGFSVAVSMRRRRSWLNSAAGFLR